MCLTDAAYVTFSVFFLTLLSVLCTRGGRDFGAALAVALILEDAAALAGSFLVADEEAAAFLERLQPNDARHVEGILIQAHGSAVFAFCMQLLSLKQHEPQRQPQTSRIRYTAPER